MGSPHFQALQHDRHIPPAHRDEKKHPPRWRQFSRNGNNYFSPKTFLKIYVLCDNATYQKDHALILAAVVVFVLFGIGVGVYISGPKYAGPATDHYDGKKFLNTSGQNATIVRVGLKWATNRDKGPWEEIKDAQYGEAPPKKANSIRVTFINHSTFLLQVTGSTFLRTRCIASGPAPFSGPVQKGCARRASGLKTCPPLIT